MGAFERLSKREKILVASMFGTLFLMVVAGLYLWLGATVGALQDEVTEGRESMARLYRLADQFQESKRESGRVQHLAEKNQDTNLKLAINDVAKGIGFEAVDVRGVKNGTTKKLADVIQYEQTHEDYLSDKKKRRRTKKKEEQIGFWRRDQKIRFSDAVPFDKIYRFLEHLERSDKMLFVTELDLRKQFQDGRYARKNAAITVSTFEYRGQEAAQ
jgi:hypothetical protein